MNFSSRRCARALAVFLLGASGCAEMPERQPSRQQIQYESNLEAYVAENPSRPANVLRAIEAKQIVRDMTLDEVRLVIEAQSMEGAHVERLWCDANPSQVAQCPADCGSCRGVIISRWGAIIHLKGKGSNPTVVDLRMTQSNRPNLGYFLANDVHLTYELARAIQAQQVVVGMTLDQVRQTLSGYDLEERYMCGTKTVETCDSGCASCTIVFHVQGTAVYLSNTAGKSVMRVTRIDPIVQ